MSELDQPAWAIVATDPPYIRSRSTDYAEAQKRMNVLEGMGASGLSIVTNETADRIEADAKATQTI